MKTAVRTVFTGIYQPAGILRRNWNPAPKDQINVRFKQPKILITSQKEEKDKELVIYSQRGERTEMCFQLQISYRSENHLSAPLFLLSFGGPYLQRTLLSKGWEKQLHGKQVINTIIFNNTLPQSPPS
ncbi:hypothetical protein ILYODFUR_036311 [Ilyodon furcidens]|uniref:Uncharacterized protein n=1 Tax=Ilyodon furcidens TaxID=33524 RepID=A0ABV0T4I6_9TELE